MNLDKWSKKRLHGDHKRRSGAKVFPIFLKIKRISFIIELENL